MFRWEAGVKTFPKFRQDESLQIIAVNMRTFSAPSKCKPVAEWANGGSTFLALDEPSSIKSVNSKRTQRILDKFNKGKKPGETVLKSVPLNNIRATMIKTPGTSGSAELWPSYDFLQPNFFGRNYWTFNTRSAMHTTIQLSEAKGGQLIKALLTEDKWKAVKDIASFNLAE
jgi:hypothetical protein